MQRRSLAVLMLAALLLANCDGDMSSQQKDTTWDAAEAPPNGLDFPLTAPDGMVTHDPPAAVPPMSMALLQHGREQYEIYCSACHSRTGDGQGVVVQRGFPAPPAFDIPRIVAEPTSHYYDVITMGYGLMYSFAERVKPADRWAIAAYIRVLQRARTGTVADIPPDQAGSLR